jgi:DNA adenine methylase
MRYVSPLRYPGGKASLSRFLMDVIDLNDLRGHVYFEPYAGGAGAALTLLRDEVVSRILINDADKRVFAFWQSALNQTERFVSKVLSVPLTIDEWHKQRDVCMAPAANSLFDVGFAAFYMNRCNRSGVLTGAGPIGGYKQAGKWKLGVRFNRESLAERLLALEHTKSLIKVTNLDAIEFLIKYLPVGRGRAKTLVYLDPPYVSNGQRLYLNSYCQSDHVKVARYLGRQSILPWIMSYDDTELVRDLYACHQVSFLPIRYSLQEKRSTKELVIAPHRVLMPRSCKVSGLEISVSHHVEGLPS